MKQIKAEGAVALICDSPKLVSGTSWDSVISDSIFIVVIHFLQSREKDF